MGAVTRTWLTAACLATSVARMGQVTLSNSGSRLPGMNREREAYTCRSPSDGFGLQTDLLGVLPYQPGADRVERPRPDERFRYSAGLLAQHLGADALDAPAHLGRGASREGHQQNATWIDAVDYQIGDPMRQCVGLARSGPGDDEQWGGQTSGFAADTMFDGPPLLDIQFGEVVGWHL
jgi:hypothetical protein